MRNYVVPVLAVLAAFLGSLFSDPGHTSLLLLGALAGLRGTGDWGTDERPKNFREYILWR